MTPPGIEPATFQLVAQWLNQLRHRVQPSFCCEKTTRDGWISGTGGTKVSEEYCWAIAQAADQVSVSWSLDFNWLPWSTHTYIHSVCKLSTDLHRTFWKVVLQFGGGECLYDEERLTEDSGVERPLMEKHHHLNTSSLNVSPHQTRKCITVWEVWPSAWRQKVHPKHPYVYMKRYAATSQTTAIFTVTDIRTSKLITIKSLVRGNKVHLHDPLPPPFRHFYPFTSHRASNTSIYNVQHSQIRTARVTDKRIRNHPEDVDTDMDNVNTQLINKTLFTV